MSGLGTNTTTTHHGALDGAGAGACKSHFSFSHSPFSSHKLNGIDLSHTLTVAGHEHGQGHTGRDALVGGVLGHEAEKHHEHHAAGKPSIGDKISGKVDEVVGKVTKNPAKVSLVLFYVLSGRCAGDSYWRGADFDLVTLGEIGSGRYSETDWCKYCLNPDTWL